MTYCARCHTPADQSHPPGWTCRGLLMFCQSCSGPGPAPASITHYGPTATVTHDRRWWKRATA